MRERQEVIRDYIVAELQKRGLCIKDVAMKLEKSQGAVQQVVRSWTSTRIIRNCLLYTSPSPRDAHESRMPSSA